jgi:hypothetical protein
MKDYIENTLAITLTLSLSLSLILTPNKVVHSIRGDLETLMREYIHTDIIDITQMLKLLKQQHENNNSDEVIDIDYSVLDILQVKRLYRGYIERRKEEYGSDYYHYVLRALHTPDTHMDKAVDTRGRTLSSTPVNRRKCKEIAKKYQQYLILAFFSNVPDRQRS